MQLNLYLFLSSLSTLLFPFKRHWHNHYSLLQKRLWHKQWPSSPEESIYFISVIWQDSIK